MSAFSAFFPLLPGLQAHGLLMQSIEDAFALVRVMPATLNGSTIEALAQKLVADGSYDGTVDELHRLAKALGTLMGDPAYQSKVMEFLKALSA